MISIVFQALSIDLNEFKIKDRLCLKSFNKHLVKYLYYFVTYNDKKVFKLK